VLPCREGRSTKYRHHGRFDVPSETQRNKHLRNSVETHRPPFDVTYNNIKPIAARDVLRTSSSKTGGSGGWVPITSKQLPFDGNNPNEPLRSAVNPGRGPMSQQRGEVPPTKAVPPSGYARDPSAQGPPRAHGGGYGGRFQPPHSRGRIPPPYAGTRAQHRYHHSGINDRYGGYEPDLNVPPLYGAGEPEYCRRRSLVIDAQPKVEGNKRFRTSAKPNSSGSDETPAPTINSKFSECAPDPDAPLSYGIYGGDGPEYRPQYHNNVVLFDAYGKSQLEGNEHLYKFVESYHPAFVAVPDDSKSSFCRFVLSMWQKQERDPSCRIVKAERGGAWSAVSDDELILWIGLHLSSSSKPPRHLGMHDAVADRTKAARKYFNDLMQATYTSISGSPGMEVLSGLCDLEAGEMQDIVVRSVTNKFWQACIDIVDDVNTIKNTKPRRVAAVGTSGIGKTMVTVILLRMLLEKGRTVAYLIRSNHQRGWLYEVIPTNGQYDVKVYPESFSDFAVPSLQLPNTYFIVDPGQTKLIVTRVLDFCPRS
jgi:hypothetical protein